MTSVSGAMASRLRTVSSMVSPFERELPVEPKLRVSAERRFSANSNDARVRVLGTSFVVEHQPKGRTDVWVVEGEVEVSGLTDGKSVRLTQRQRTHLGPKTPPAKPRSYRPSEMSEWDKILEGLEGAVDEFKDLFR